MDETCSISGDNLSYRNYISFLNRMKSHFENCQGVFLWERQDNGSFQVYERTKNCMSDIFVQFSGRELNKSPRKMKDVLQEYWHKAESHYEEVRMSNVQLL